MPENHDEKHNIFEAGKTMGRIEGKVDGLCESFKGFKDDTFETFRKETRENIHDLRNRLQGIVLEFQTGKGMLEGGKKMLYIVWSLASAVGGIVVVLINHLIKEHKL